MAIVSKGLYSCTTWQTPLPHASISLRSVSLISNDSHIFVVDLHFNAIFGTKMHLSEVGFEPMLGKADSNLNAAP